MIVYRGVRWVLLDCQTDLWQANQSLTKLIAIVIIVININIYVIVIVINIAKVIFISMWSSLTLKGVWLKRSILQDKDFIKGLYLMSSFCLSRGSHWKLVICHISLAAGGLCKCHHLQIPSVTWVFCLVGQVLRRYSSSALCVDICLWFAIDFVGDYVWPTW